MSSDRENLPRETAAEAYFKSWDDAAARLVRSVFLLGAGLLGLLLLPLVARPILEVASDPLSLAGFYRFAASVVMALIFLGGSLGSLLWGVVVLVAGIDASKELIQGVFRVLGVIAP